MEIAKRNIVKIQSHISNGETVEGSGVIINQPINSDYIYVITARHCIYSYNSKDKQNKEYLRKEIEFVACVYKYDDKNKFSSVIKAIDWIDNEQTDIALIKFPKAELLDLIPEGELESITIYNDCQEKDELISYGYTSVSPNEVEEIQSICQRKEQSNSEFRIETTKPLTTYTGAKSQDFVAGYSGSGTFIDNSNFLIGIVIENPNSLGANILRCVRLESLNKLIEAQTGNWIKLKIEENFYNPPPKKGVFMEHFLNIKNENEKLNDAIFNPISEEKTILLLGPNILNENKYFSSIYKEFCIKNDIDYKEFKDIIDFTDNIFLDPNYPREKFDNFIGDYIEKVEAPDYLENIAKLNWREILSFNMDVKFEACHDKVNQIQELETILSKNIYHKGINAKNIKYVRLNGSVRNQDYPPVISTVEFRKQKKFYDTVLNGFKATSYKIKWLAVGFSINDPFSMRIIDLLSNYFKNEGKLLYLIDENVSNYRLHSLKEKNISLIKSTNETFFTLLNEYIDKNELILKRKGVSFTNKNKTNIILSARQKHILHQTVEQITDKYQRHTNAVDFYKGNEPTFNVILQNFDIQRPELVEKTVNILLKSFDNTENENDVPLFLITGNYGIGKSTHSLRVIKQLLNNEEVEILAFEIYDTDNVDIEVLIELFRKSECNNYILFVKHIEKDSAFKSVFSLKNKLSNQDLSDINITILSSIRINILKRNTYEKRFSNQYYEININKPLNSNEIDELLTKLNDKSLLNIRDAKTKEKLKKTIQDKYNGDILTALMVLIEDSRHVNFIKSAFDELSLEIRQAFIYTSLLYRFKIPMPASILKDLVTGNWNDFIVKVISQDGYDILIQTAPTSSQSNEPDILFKTRHSDISEKIIEKILKTKDKQFTYYKAIFNMFIDNYSMSKLIIDIIKSIERNNILTQNQINELYTIGHVIFKDNSHFNLFYTNNLMKNKDFNSLEKARSNIERIYYNESEFGKRNHRIIHKRGEVCFELAKYYSKNEDDSLIEKYLDDAEEFFELKRILDPFSSFSYRSYIRMKIWELENFEYSENAQKKLEIISLIEDLFDDAEKYVVEQEELIEERNNFNNLFSLDTVDSYFEENENIEIDSPQYLILKYYYYIRKGEDIEAVKMINNLEESKELNYVAKLLFKHYGRNLYVKDNRVKLVDLIKYNKHIRDTNPVRYNYYKYITAVYDYIWSIYYSTIKTIRKNYEFLNPKIYEEWKNEDGLVLYFTGIIKKGDNKKYIRIQEFSKNFPLIKGNYKNVQVGDTYKVELRFYMTGIKVRLINKIDK